MGTNTPTFYTIKQHAIGYGFWSVPNLLEIYVIEKLMFFFVEHIADYSDSTTTQKSMGHHTAYPVVVPLQPHYLLNHLPTRYLVAHKNHITKHLATLSSFDLPSGSYYSSTFTRYPFHSSGTSLKSNILN